MSFFNPNEVSDEDELVPVGPYRFLVSNAEVKPTRSGGTMISVKLQVIDGEHAKRVVFHNFNTRNDNEVAQRIGQADFKAFAYACFGEHRVFESAMDIGQVINCTVGGNVIHEDSKDGVTRARIKGKSWKQDGASAQAKPTNQAKKPAAAKPAGRPAPVGPVGNDDDADIPFAPRWD